MVISTGISRLLRAEVAVRGEAEVTRGEEIFTLRADQSTYIPHETKYRLRNPSKQPLEIIEVQRSTYVGEDGIVRFKDNYGRAEEYSHAHPFSPNGSSRACRSVVSVTASVGSFFALRAIPHPHSFPHASHSFRTR